MFQEGPLDVHVRDHPDAPDHAAILQLDPGGAAARDEDAGDARAGADLAAGGGQRGGFAIWDIG
jgi:hypothetical protein